jgi:glycosyltransferase involved in cell wall biosynthesis
MKTNTKKLKVALVTESLWSMGGANRVLEAFAEIYPKADIYALFGDKDKISKELQKHRILFSFLNNRPFIETFYRYCYHLWPQAIERFCFNDYDLVISSSSSVALGVVTPATCKHIAYIHSPLRYLWDLRELGLQGFRSLAKLFLVFLRVWEISASSRPDILIANSEFVKKRIVKYWKRTPDYVLAPPVSFYDGAIKTERDNYIVAGAPFEFNKRGDFLLSCIAGTDINLKLIGTGSMVAKLKMKYKKYKNIKFLGNISEQGKWEVLSNASCFVIPGIEDYGIFPVEAMSAGTPVLGFKAGGILENLKEGINGYYFTRWEKKNFLDNLKRVIDKKWNYGEIAKSVRGNNNTKEEFKKKFEAIVGDIS